MIRVKCAKCGQRHPPGEPHECPAASEGVNDNTDKPIPFDEKQWRRGYMRDYMRGWRRRKQGPQEPIEPNEPKDQAS